MSPAFANENCSTHAHSFIIVIKSIVGLLSCSVFTDYCLINYNFITHWRKIKQNCIALWRIEPLRFTKPKLWPEIRKRQSFQLPLCISATSRIFIWKLLRQVFFTQFLTESSKWFTLSSSDKKESNCVIGFVIAEIYSFSVDETWNVDWEDSNVQSHNNLYDIITKRNHLGSWGKGRTPSTRRVWRVERNTIAWPSI